jgi:hypothetical protein
VDAKRQIVPFDMVGGAENGTVYFSADKDNCNF